MDFGFIAYIFVCVVITLFTFSKLSGSDRMVAAIASLVLFILIFVFYGKRWFRGESSAFKYGGAWPPVINMCPDYLVYFKNGTQDTCVDLIGVAKEGGLSPWTQEDINNPPSSANKYFNHVYKPGMPSDKLKELCDATMRAGLTWEGITSGESCTYTNA
jgi:hypothetical protein